MISICILQITTRKQISTAAQSILVASLYCNITSCYRITTSKAANILITNYLLACLCVYIHVYICIMLPVPSAHQTHPRSGANQSLPGSMICITEPGVSLASLVRVRSAEGVSWGMGVVLRHFSEKEAPFWVKSK